MSEHNWIDSYLHTHYMGCIQGRYDIGCRLYLKDINNFIQNIGRYANVEIVRLEDDDTLLNTRGTEIDRILPQMSWGDRNTVEMREFINSIAVRLGELRAQEGLFPDPLPKVEQFMKEALGQQIVDENIGFLKDVHQENETMEMLIQ